MSLDRVLIALAVVLGIGYFTVRSRRKRSQPGKRP
jgi:hypothetical protein